MKLFWKTNRDSVADTVAQRAAEAAAIARVSGQELLHDPWAHPEVRPHAERLLIDQQHQTLNAAHGRTSRRIRVLDRRAARAEASLEVLADARETTSPARAVLELHRDRQLFMRVALGASIALSVGAGMGLNKLVVDRYNAPEGIGFFAEIGLTGLSTAAILYRSRLSQHSSTKPEMWHSAVLIALMLIPLAISCAGNIVAAGLAGIACSAGSAAFSLLSYVVAESSANAITAQADNVKDADADELQRMAVDGDLFTVVREPDASTVHELEPVHEPTGEHIHELDASANNDVHEPKAPVVHEPEHIHEPAPVREPAEDVDDVDRVRELDADEALAIAPALAALLHSTPSVDAVREPAEEPVHELENADQPQHEEATADAVPPQPAEPAPVATAPRPTTAPRKKKDADVADLSPRALRRAEEIQAVLDLFAKRGGPEKVDMGEIQKELGFKRSNAYNRRQQALELWQPSPEEESMEFVEPVEEVREPATSSAGS